MRNLIFLMAFMPIIGFGQEVVFESKCENCKPSKQKCEITVISQVDDENTTNPKLTQITFENMGITQDSILCGVYKLFTPKTGCVLIIDQYNTVGQIKHTVLTNQSKKFTIDLTKTVWVNIFYQENTFKIQPTQ